MPQVTISNKEVVYDGSTRLQKITYAVVKQGKQAEQTREVLEHKDAATCLLYNPQQQTVLLTRQFRIATYINGNKDGMLVETPAGLLEDGEAAAATMMREITEETGYEVSGVQQVFEAYSSPGSYTEKVHYFIAEYRARQKKEAGGGLEEEGEDIDLVELSFSEALAQLEQGVIQDVKTIVLLQYALLKGLLQG